VRRAASGASKSDDSNAAPNKSARRTLDSTETTDESSIRRLLGGGPFTQLGSNLWKARATSWFRTRRCAAQVGVLQRLAARSRTTRRSTPGVGEPRL
jgi:hypothetical protein